MYADVPSRRLVYTGKSYTKIEATCPSRNIVPIYHTTWWHSLKDRNMNLLRRRDNNESYSLKCVLRNRYKCIFICETKTNLWLISQSLPPLLILFTGYIFSSLLFHLFLIISKYFIAIYICVQFLHFFCMLMPYSCLAISYLNTLFFSFLSLDYSKVWAYYFHILRYRKIFLCFLSFLSHLIIKLLLSSKQSSLFYSGHNIRHILPCSMQLS